MANIEKNKKMQASYGVGEERFNWITHLCGIVLSVIATVIMSIKVAEGYSVGKYGVNGIVAVILFSFGLIAVYSISTAYHLTRYGSTARTVMRKLDHCTITILILGSYMPYLLIGLFESANQPTDTVWGIVLASILLAMSIAEIVLNLVAMEKCKYVILALYIAMGWLIVIAIVPLFNAVGLPALILLISGGIAYTVGAMFYKFIKVKFAHGIFHIFVIAGSLLMFLSILMFLL